MIRIPPEVRAIMAEIARKAGALGGKKAAQNMTAEQRRARAKKASDAAARKRTEKRIAAGRQAKAAKKAKRK